MSELKPGIYKHYKGGIYELLFLATHTETLEEVCVYKALYGEEKLWVRPRAMWEEKVIVNGTEIDRFSYIGPKKQRS